MNDKRGREKEKGKGKRLVAGISRWLILGLASLVKLALCAPVTGPLSLWADLQTTTSFLLSVCLPVPKQLRVVFLMYSYLFCLSSERHGKLSHLIGCTMALLCLGTVGLVRCVFLVKNKDSLCAVSPSLFADSLTHWTVQMHVRYRSLE